MGSTPDDGSPANDRIAAKEREIRGELPPHVAEEHILYRVLALLAPSLTETEADALAHRLARLPAVAVYLAGPELPLPAIRRFVVCWRRRRKGWCRFLVETVSLDGDDAHVSGAWRDALRFLYLSENSPTSPNEEVRELLRRQPRLVDALRRWGLEPDAPYFAYFALALEGSAASAAVLRNLLSSARCHALDWLWAFRNLTTSGGDEMKVLAADVLAAGRAKLNGTPLPAWLRQVGVQRAVDELSLLVELSGRCMSLEADSKKLDHVELSFSLHSRPCDWSRIELLGGDDGGMLLVWVQSDVVRGTCFDLDAPTLLTLPEWLGDLTRRFEVAWGPPRMHPHGWTESEQERVLAWLLGNRLSSNIEGAGKPIRL